MGFYMLRFDLLKWGTVVIDGREYHYDVVVTPDGVLKPRTREEDKFGSHTFEKGEFSGLIDGGAKVIIIGTGTDDLARLSKGAEDYLGKAGVELIQLESGEAIEKYNELVEKGRKVGAIIHITC